MGLTPEEPQDPVEKRREQWRAYYQLHGAAAKRKKGARPIGWLPFFKRLPRRTAAPQSDTPNGYF